MELVVSSTSWERAQEGYFLGTLGLSHYAGGVFTGSPLMLAAVAFCAMLPAAAQTLAAAMLFAGVDLASALLLRSMCVRAVAVESCDWETHLEEWMEEDSKPATASGPVPSRNPSPGSPNTSEGITPKSGPVAGDTKGRAPNGGGGTAFHENGSPTRDDGAAWNLPDIVLAVYFLNPVIAGQCAALSGDVLGRVLPLAALAAAGSGRPGATAAALAAAACLWRFHAAPLILPAALMLGAKFCGADGCASTRENGLDGEGRGSTPGVSLSSSEVAGGAAEAGSGALHDPRYFELDGMALLRLSLGFLVGCAAVLGACWAATSGSWAFLGAAAKGQLLCENLTPNIGLYWYFFAELFPRFRGFFRVLFLSQPYVYVLPATLRLGMFPEALASLLLAIFGLFQPYPTMADPILAGCLFLCHPRTSARMRLVIPVGMAALVPSLLLPTMRHLWLQAGTGNANFYYFQTVALNVLLAVFVLQFAAALVKRRKALAVAFERRRKAWAGEAEAGAAASERNG
eukprot:g6855.t1